MVAKTSIYYDIVTEFQNKGAKQAQNSFGVLEKSAVSLGKKLATVFGTAALLKFGKDAVNAAAQENKAFTILGNTLNNLGLGFANASAKPFIEGLALATGTTIDTLIPAYQQLLVATGDVALSQKDLQIAMDVSAGTGKDLSTVTTALSKGYLGNTTSLTRLGAGLDKAVLKSGDMNKIMQRLSETFGGSAAKAADTAAGKMARLGEAARQATVQIGDGLISAFTSLAAGGSMTGATNQILAFGKTVGDAAAGVGDLITALKKVPYIGDAFAKIFKGIADTTGIVALTKILAKVHETTIKPSGATTDIQLQHQADLALAAQKKVIANKAAQAKLDAQILTSQKSQTLEMKNQALLKILGTVSQDFERANIMAALAHAQTQEIKDQLQYQLDLLDATNQTGAAQAATIDNAIILKEKMLLAQGQVMLVDGSIVNLATAKNPFAGFDQYVQDALNGILKVQQALTLAASVPTVSTIAPGYPNPNLYGGGLGDFGVPTITSPTITGSTGMPNPNLYGGGLGNFAAPSSYGNASSTINLNLSLDPGLVVSATNASTANGSAITINRTSNQFAAV
jgi:hypothetical protein